MNTKQKWSGLVPSTKEEAIRVALECPIVGRELFNYLCGEMLGFGMSRHVFVYRPNPRYVIKIDNSNLNTNVIEHHNWCMVQDTPHAKWFAECKDLSPCGRILIQRRAKVPKDYSRYPKKVPTYFWDLKYQNWGEIDGRIVCVDYAGTSLVHDGLTNKMMVAKWWDHKPNP